MNKKLLLIGAGFVVAVGGAAAAQAARPDSGAWHGRTFSSDSTHRHRGHERVLFKNITLTAAQKAQLDGMRKAGEQNEGSSRDQMRAQFDSARAAKARGDTTAANNIMTNLRAQMDQRRAQEFAKIRTVLTADQQKQFDANVAEMKAHAADWQKHREHDRDGDKPGSQG